MPEPRTSIVVLTGFYHGLTARVAQMFAEQWPDCVVVNHDLKNLAEGVVIRRVHHAGKTVTTVLELAHGCISCTLREDLLPLLHRLAASGIVRVVVQCDPALEPEQLCWAAEHMVSGDHTLTDLADIEAVIAVVDSTRWFDVATSNSDLVDRGLPASPNDDRTVAHIALSQVEFADVVLADVPADSAGLRARTDALLARLAPRAVRGTVSGFDVETTLASVPVDARRGAADHSFTALLRGEPPLGADAGLALIPFSNRRPFHPERLHDALDVLLDEAVIRARGRVWTASQPDVAMWLEAAGGGLHVGHAGPWLAAVDQAEWADVDQERRVIASLNWDPYYGDRAQELAIICEATHATDMTQALTDALLTDAELAEGEATWRTYQDPFGEWHVDPCVAPAHEPLGSNQHRPDTHDEQR